MRSACSFLPHVDQIDIPIKHVDFFLLFRHIHELSLYIQDLILIEL